MSDEPFEAAEFRDRVGRLTAQLVDRGVEVMLVLDPVDMYYFTGYRSTGFFEFQALIIRADGALVMVSRRLEQMLYEQTSWSPGFHAYADGDDPRLACASALDQAGLGSATIGVPRGSRYLSLLDLDALAEHLPDTSWVDVGGLVTDLRAVKSAAEIEKIRQAGLLTTAAVRAAQAEALVGRSENDIAAAFLDAAIRGGSGRPADGPLVGSGPRSALGHATWENRRLVAGDLVFVEGSGCVDRYHAPAMRTLSVGTPSSQATEMADVSRRGLEAALAAMRPGVTAGHLDRVCREVIAGLGMSDYFRHRTGYSTGIGFTTWHDGISVAPNSPLVLKENMVIHVVPYLSTGAFAVTTSETARVTADGGEPLVGLPRQILETEQVRAA